MAELLTVMTPLLIGLAAVGAVRQHRIDHPRPLKIHGDPIEWPLNWAEELKHAEHDHRPLAQLTEIQRNARRELARQHRHNGRCRTCGRFAKYVPGLAPLVSCGEHGRAIGAITGPIVLPVVLPVNPYTGSISIQLGAAA